jgi:hypothetical protein
MSTKASLTALALLLLGTASAAAYAQPEKFYPGIVVRPGPNGDPNPPSALAGHPACAAHYDTFDFDTRTYVGDDGKRHLC